jgi:serine/threonine protein phosphatase PrpC
MSKQLNRRLARFGDEPSHHHHEHGHEHDEKCSHKNHSTAKFFNRVLVARFGVVIALVFGYFNFFWVAHSAGSSKMKSKNYNNSKGQRQPMVLLPQFPKITYPAVVDSDTTTQPHNVAQKWDRWAEEPTIGSYTFTVSKKDPHHPISTNLHLPIIDMEYLPLTSAGKNKIGLLSNTANNNNVVPAIDMTLASPDYVVLTRRGEKYSIDGSQRQANQDRVGLLSASSRTSDSTNAADNNDGDWWIGLFDGHGTYGHAVAQYSMLEFVQHMEDELTMPKSTTSRALKTQTTAANKESLKNMFLNVHRSMPHLDSSGCTGISIWKRGHQLFISNVGDSLAFVVRYDPKQLLDTPTTTTNKVVPEIIYETKPHKPDSPLERQRIEGVGGQIEEAPFPGFSARLVIPSEDGLTAMALAMSRSLGDHDGEPYGLLAEPTTDVLDLSALKASDDGSTKESGVEYLVVACTDGLVDHVEPVEVARELAIAFSSGQAGLPVQAAERLILKSSAIWAGDAMEGGYRDDISIVVRRLVLS